MPLNVELLSQLRKQLLISSVQIGFSQERGAMCLNKGGQSEDVQLSTTTTTTTAQPVEVRGDGDGKSLTFDNTLLISLGTTAAVIILLLIVLLIYCFIRNRRQKEVIKGMKKGESVDENPDYGIYRDGCVEYSTVIDKNSVYDWFLIIFWTDF